MHRRAGGVPAVVAGLLVVLVGPLGTVLGYGVAAMALGFLAQYRIGRHH
ncbi:hypothetical protein ABZ723_09555 [Streptomyces sp. NPDC006700]